MKITCPRTVEELEQIWKSSPAIHEQGRPEPDWRNKVPYLMAAIWLGFLVWCLTMTLLCYIKT